MTAIVITEFMDDPAVATLRERWSVCYDPDAFSRMEKLNTGLHDTRVLIVRNRTQVTAELLSQCPALTAIGRLGVGLDNIDMDACDRLGVKVYPATGANDRSVAEYVLATTMFLRRGAFFARAAMEAGAWPRMELMGHEIASARLGLVGVGRIARETGRIAASLGMSVAGYDPYVDADDPIWATIDRHDTLRHMLAEADVVSLHVPLNASTRSLIDARALSAMKHGAILINAARGGIVDESALAQTLREGKLSGAALDVFATEPLNAKAGETFAGIPNLILTPHVAGLTFEANARVSMMIAKQIAAHLDSGSDDLGAAPIE